MAGKRSSQPYLSYLLRLWQTSDGNEYVWRASLQCPGSGERHGFAGLEEMFQFLYTQTHPDEPGNSTRLEETSEGADRQ